MVGAIIPPPPLQNPFLPKTFSLKKLPKDHFFKSILFLEGKIFEKKSNPKPFG
jgi:hypothetical protein